MPCETVYHTRLDAEYAVPTVSLAADVQRPSSPGPPKAAPEPSTHLYSAASTAIRVPPIGSLCASAFQAYLSTPLCRGWCSRFCGLKFCQFRFESLRAKL